MAIKYVVAGGGIVGLTVAREILLRFPDAKVTLLEKERSLAMHQTGHNSGVIHSGIYYPPDSEKARGCREGIPLLNAFCDRHAIARKKVGKVIVATDDAELATLERISVQGKAVAGMRLIGRDELRDVEPAIDGIKAIHLPDVAIIDYRTVCGKLREEIVEKGGEVFVAHKVLSVTDKVIETEQGSYQADHFINCGGLHSDRIAEASGVKSPVRIIPFRGEYFTLADRMAREIRGLVYPVPDPRYPFLGVHLTPMMDGRVTAGPNAVLALAREGYGWRNINLRDVADAALFPGFWRMAMTHWKTGLFELTRSAIKPLYAGSVRKFLPQLSDADLLPGDSGVRAQAVDGNGTLIHDFLYVRGPRSTHILNAPSPAATASFSIARRIVDLLPAQ